MFSKEQADFLKRFFPLFFVLYASIHLLPLGFVNEGIASIQAHALGELGVEASAKGALVLTRGVDFHIIIDCSGLVMSALFAALVLSTSVKRKAERIALGVPALLLLNQFRLLATMLVGVRYGTAALDAAHFALWFFDGLLVLALWHAALSEKS